jgi:hypothetical protein
MADAKSSKATAALASDIMAMAQKGGPIQHFKQGIIDAFPEETINTDFLDRLDGVFRPYIDNAESLAASVLRQRQK